MSEKILFNKKEAAAMLNLSVPHLQREVKAGNLQCVRIGRRVLFKREHLEEYVKKHE